VFFREWRFLTGERLQLVTDRRRSYDRFLRTLLVQGQEAGDLATGVDVKYVSFFLLGALNTAPSWYRRDGRDFADTIARNFADLCVSTVLGTRAVLSHKEQASMIRRYIIWRNNHAYDERPGRIAGRANVA